MDKFFITWEPPLMCLAWKILITFGREVNRNGAFPKITFISILKIWSLAPLQILASLCKGTIYLIFCWVITFSNKRQIWEHYCHPHALCIVNVGCIMIGSFLPWITMFSYYFYFGGALHLCFAVSERVSEIPLSSCYIMVVLMKCCHLRYLIIAR